MLGLGVGALASNVFARSPAFAHGPTLALGIAAVLLVLGLVACGRPMRRVLRIQPTEALRDGVWGLSDVASSGPSVPLS